MRPLDFTARLRERNDREWEKRVVLDRDFVAAALRGESALELEDCHKETDNDHE